MTPAASVRKVEHVSIAIGEAQVTIPAEAAALAYLEQRIDERRAPTLAFVSTAESRILFPAIGVECHGGISAGLSIYYNAPVGLVLLPEQLDRATHHEGEEHAKKLGGTLGSRVDHLVLRLNLRAKFQDAYYWCEELHESNSGYAWCQGFGDGGQGYDGRDSQYRACVVRRIAI
jgi:hypothetical protein